jgi:ABC-type sugar transport system substrate-binding protein
VSDKVVVALPDRSNEFQHLQASDAQATAARLGIPIEVMDADSNAVLQIQQLFKFIHAADKPRAILVEPVSTNGLERVAQKATAAGIGFGFMNTTVGYVDALRGQYPKLPIFSIGSDQLEIGRLQARQIRALLPDGGTVLYIQGPAAAMAAQERAHGTQEALAGSRIKLVVLDAQWTDESAEQAVRKWLRLRTTEAVQVDLVAGQDDAIARGARTAIESSPDVARQWSGIPYLGIDGVPSVGQRMVQEGQLTATIVMPSNVGPALEAMGRFMKAGLLPPASIRAQITSLPPEDSLRGPRR